MDLQQVGCKGLNWIDVAQNSVQWRTFVKLEMKIRFP